MKKEFNHKSFNNLSDEKCVKMAVDGINEAYDELIKRYHDKIYGLAYRMLGNVQDADDTTQESFLEAYKSLKSFQHRSKFSTWLYRVAINTCQQFIRKNKSRRRAIAGFEEKAKQTAVSPKTPDYLALEKERNQLIQSVIGQLPEKQKTVVVLFYMQHLKYREIAELLDCSEGTVASRLNTALKNLRPKLIRRLNRF